VLQIGPSLINDFGTLRKLNFESTVNPNAVVLPSPWISRLKSKANASINLYFRQAIGN
jgi:hypothetical protein